MKRSLYLLFVLILILVACSPATEPAATNPPPPEPTIKGVETPSSDGEQPVVAPTEAVSTEAFAETPSEPTDIPDVETAEETAVGSTAVEPTATLAPAAEEEAVINGPYENTFFRGSAAAPVTMIDYSDFL